MVVRRQYKPCLSRVHFVLYLLPLHIVLTGYKLSLDDTEYNACNPIRCGHEVYKDTKRLPT
jgi:hypothetical protein